MTEKKYAQGPWTFDGPKHNIIVWSDDRNRVCFMTSDGPAKENAMLISAAPDLLEACKKAVKFIEWHYPNVAFNGHTEDMKKAIAKAEQL